MVGTTPRFTERSNAFDEAFRGGERPGDKNRLGPNPDFITDPKDFASSFVNQKFNPKGKGFWNQVFSAETAGLSQDKINAAASTDESNFKTDVDNQYARDFLTKYSGPGGAIERGLVESDRAVTKEGLARLTTQSAVDGSSFSDPNTANRFPSQGVSVG